MMISAPITGIGASIMAVKTNVKLSSLLLIVVPLFRVMQIKIDRINLVLREQISGIRVIRAFVHSSYPASFNRGQHSFLTLFMLGLQSWAVIEWRLELCLWVMCKLSYNIHGNLRCR